MTTEEKAKAYDEALKIARCWLNDPQTIQDCNYTIEDAIQNIFPQLRESEDEDERMWKLIKKYAHYNISDMALNADHITRKELEDWLERQKECVADNSNTSESDDEKIREELIEYHKRQFENNRDQEVGLFHKDAIAWLEKQKEQNVVPSRETILGIWELGNLWKENPEKREGLTQLQYIQKYWFEKNDYLKEQKPDENERIRSMYSEYLYDSLRTSMEQFMDRFESAITWFERQKEQKSIDLSEMMVHKEPYIAPVPTPMVTDEQKPAEYIPDSVKFSEGYKTGREVGFREGVESVKPAEWSEDIIRKAVKEVGLTQHQIDWFKTNVFPPKQEWNEEDERMLSRCIKSIECSKKFADSETYKAAKDVEINWLKDIFLNHKKFTEAVDKLCSNEWSDEDKEALDMCLDAIPKRWKTKSGILLTKWLKDNIHLQPKQEWSEEDDLNCNRIIRFLEPHKTFFPTKETKEDMQNWLKNRLKSLRPSWKPSEVHLSALLAIFNDPNNIDSQTCQLALTDLYEQLKKL